MRKYEGIKKVELNCHLDGSLDIELAAKWSKLSKEEITNKLTRTTGIKDLSNYLEKFDSSIYATASVIYSTISPLNIKVDRDVNKNIVLLHQQQTMYLESKTYSEAYAICFYRDINKNVYKALIEINYIVPIQKEESPNVYFTLQSLQCSLFQEDSIKYNNIIKNNEKLKEEISKYEQLYCDGIE